MKRSSKPKPKAKTRKFRINKGKGTLTTKGIKVDFKRQGAIVSGAQKELIGSKSKQPMTKEELKTFKAAEKEKRKTLRTAGRQARRNARTEYRAKNKAQRIRHATIRTLGAEAIAALAGEAAPTAATPLVQALNGGTRIVNQNEESEDKQGKVYTPPLGAYSQEGRDEP